MGLSLFGDWDKATGIVKGMEAKWKQVSKSGVMKEANFLRGKIIEGMREQAPGGTPFKPLSPLTLAVRALAGFAGTKALIRRGDLRNAIVVQSQPDGGAFVGVLRTAKGKGGEDLVNVAEENEFGAGPIIVPITPKSRAFYHAAIARAGIEPPASAGGSGEGLAVAIVRIPARPIFQPVFDKYAHPEDVRERFYHHVVHEMAGELGELGGGGEE